MAAPSIPQRPARSQQQNMPTASQPMDGPRIPPRPKRNVERSVSPQRESFARSPLNDPSFTRTGLSHALPKSLSRDVPPRPPSVTLPSIGDEGNEYANLDNPEADAQQAPIEQTKNVAGDLPLHAPKASLPATTAVQRVAAVTRTDSSQAAALGIGKPGGDADSFHVPSSLPRSLSSQAGSRPASLYRAETHEHENEELGIPEIGLQVPMYPNAGDVQAPTPSPSAHLPSTGVGFFNNGGSHATGRNHSRTKSGREVFQGPPGSYGLHGHGVNAKDPFEKAWYEKHPDAMAQEAKGEYGPAIQEGRKEWALSSEELNRLVHAKAVASMSIDRGATSTPNEQIGFLASEEYTSRLNSSRPSSVKPRRQSSQTHTESPLRKMSFAASEMDNSMRQESSKSANHDHALESEAEDDAIHVDQPSRVTGKMSGGGYDPPTQDLGPHGGNTEDEGGYVVETGYGVPILASDEILHRPEAQFMQPAIEPEMEHRDNDYMIDADTSLSGRRSGTHSRSNSIPKISHNVARFANEDRGHSGTPLENLKEYEPLFPEDEEEEEVKPTSTRDVASKVKRPDVLARHHFPSQDVWEDTPSSLMHQTTVETPQLPDQSNPAAEHESKEFFESPEAEAARKSAITKSDQENFLPDSTKVFAKKGLKADLIAEVPPRPGTRQRFPSQDVWEDSPESQNYTATVGGPQQEEEEEDVEAVAKPPPQIPARPAAKSLTAEKVASPTEERKAPTLPGRPKPQIPARSSKLSSSWNEEQPTLSKTISGASAEADLSAVKAKPPVPVRPAGGKIAALQATFMSDLNKRLQVGPVAPKKETVDEEPVEEKAPLADARKGRARGPQRRKPGVSPASAEESATPAKPPVRFAMSKPQTIWEMDESGDVILPVPKAAAESEPLSKDVETTKPSKSDIKPTVDGPPLEQRHMQTYEQEMLPEKEAITSAPEEAASRSTDPETAAEVELHKVGPLTKQSRSSSLDSSAQTGQLELLITKDMETGAMEKTSVYLGGRAPEPGSIVVHTDDTTHVRTPDELGQIEKVGSGI